MILDFYYRLLELYGEQHWWPNKSGMRWEILAGAILVQNTAWSNVERTLTNLENAGLMAPERVLSMPDCDLRELIRPSGFFQAKCAYLKALAAFFLDHEGELLQSEDVPALRRQLLAVNGVGKETADDILLYAFQKPIFVIDAYTRRVATRHLGIDGTLPYEELQKTFMEALPQDVQLYGEYHALFLALCKDSCRKNGCGATCQHLQ